MKKILIVDDERPARELLKMSLNWQELGFDTPLEAANGKNALELYKRERPDFVITDIEMPIMNGLDLIAQIKAICPQQPVVILSCYESFAFAQRALRMGVCEYILKDAMNPDQLAEVLLTSLPEQAQEPQQVAYQDMLGGYMQGQVEAHDMQTWLDGQLTEQEYLCFACQGQNGMEDEGTIADVKQALLGVLGGLYGGDACWRGDSRFFVLAKLPYSNSAMESIHQRTALLRACRSALEPLLGTEITIGVSRNADCGALLEEKLQEAKAALESYVFFGKGKTLYYDINQTPTCEGSSRTLNLRVALIKRALLEGEQQVVSAELAQLYQKDLSGMMQYHYVVYVNMLLLSLLTEQCIAQKLSFEVIFDSETLVQPPEQVGCETIAEMEAWFATRFLRYFACVQKKETFTQSPRTHKICVYIEENITSDISLETVATHFGLHKVYLAKVFKAEMQCSVNEYIRTCKTDRAKQLLAQKNLKISAIIEMLGYNNPQTFYNMFRHCVGVSPSEYREGLQ